MNDLDLVRTVLDDVPPASPARLAVGRARLVAATKPGGPRRRPCAPSSRRWPVAWPACVATVAAAATVIAFAVTGGGAPKPQETARAAQPARSAQSETSLTAKVLGIAAKTVASEPVTEPGPHQWFYYETFSTETGQPAEDDNEWITFDGTQSAYYGSPYAGAPVQLIVHHEPASAVPSSSPGASGLAAFDVNAVPLTAYNALASLSASPSELLAAVDADIVASNQTNFGVMGTASTTAQKEFAYLGQLLWNAYAAAPPSALSAVYQAIATIPGVTVNQGLRDAAGSPAVGITDDGGATEILLNPQTYQVVGINLTWVVPSKAQQVKKVGEKSQPPGTDTNSIAYLRIAEVSGPGQR